jgi:flagellar biogenesis protein FliO
MTFDTLILAVAAGLFVMALIALMAWAFKTFFPGKHSGQGFMRREKRLGVVETASIDQKRKLLLIRRDDVEHLIIIGGPIDMLVETGIKGRPHLEPPLEDVIIARSETRPAPDFSQK